MATKKPEPIEEEIPAGEQLVSIKLPLTKDMSDDVFVRVNQRTWLIKRGVYVDVPQCVAEVLEHSERAELEAIEYMTAHQKGEG